MLYELLTVTLPFAAQTLAGVTHRVLRVAPPPLCDHRPDAPVAMQQIIDRALARDPAERFDTAIDFAAALSVAFTDAANETSDLVLDSRTEKLKSSAFFADFKDAEIWELLRWAAWEEFATGDILIEEGDVDADAVYVLFDGRALVTEQGKPVRALCTGECFGEIGFLGERQSFTTVVATTDVAVVSLNARTIVQATLQCQVQFQRVFIRTLLERLVATTEDLVQQG